MRDPLSEAAGCVLLARVFRSRGYAIKRDVIFNELGVKFRVDGWDARARVGFEFLSSEAHDHDELTLGEFKRLMAAQQRGELAIFVVDESEQLSEADLAAAAGEFLDEFAAVRGPRRPGGRRATPRQARPQAGSRARRPSRPATGAKPAAKPTTRARRPARRKR